MRCEVDVPKHLRQLAALHFRGSTTVGYLAARITGWRAAVRLEVGARSISFVFPIRNRANFRLIRGQFSSGRYDISVPYESGLISYLARCLAEGSVFIDIGANAGWFSLIASRLVGEPGAVYAFEPDAQNFRALCDNIYRQNAMSNCFVLPVALSNCEQLVSLARPAFDDGTGLFMSSDGANRTLCARADRILKDLPERPAHVKIDVEAAEYLVMEGFGEMAKRISSFAIEVSGQSMERFGIPYGKLFTLMEAYGFSPSRLNADGSLTAIHAPMTGDVVFERR